MMAGIRRADTRPELVVRRGLHARGFRFRLHDARLPGRPDLVLRKHGVAVFVHGCFWHGHDCNLFKRPATRREFWSSKIARNVERDGESMRRLHEAGWRTLVVWECSMKGRRRLDPQELFDRLCEFITSTTPHGEVEG